MDELYGTKYEGLRLGGYTQKVGFDDSIFEDDRINFLVQICEKHFKKSKSINKNVSSYNLKHRVEALSRLWYELDLGNYVSNGELIFAMLKAGFHVERHDPNAYFNVSDASYHKFCKLIKEQEKLYHSKGDARSHSYHSPSD